MVLAAGSLNQCVRLLGLTEFSFEWNPNDLNTRRGSLHWVLQRCLGELYAWSDQAD